MPSLHRASFTSWPSLPFVISNNDCVLFVEGLLHSTTNGVWSSLDTDGVDGTCLLQFGWHELHLVDCDFTNRLSTNAHLIDARLVKRSVKLLLELDWIGSRVFTGSWHLHFYIFLMSTAHKLIRCGIPRIVLGRFSTRKTSFLVRFAHHSLLDISRSGGTLSHGWANTIGDNCDRIVVLEDIKATRYILIGKVDVLWKLSLLLIDQILARRLVSRSLLVNNWAYQLFGITSLGCNSLIVFLWLDRR